MKTMIKDVMLLLIKSITLVIIFYLLKDTSYQHDKVSLITQAIEKGIEPSTVICALEGEKLSSRKMCLGEKR